MSAPDRLFPGFKTPPNDPSRTIAQRRETPPRHPVSTDPKPEFTREFYRTECGKRWDGPALQDASAHWQHWQDLHDPLEEAMRTYKRNPTQEDMAGTHHNPSGRLTDFLWNLQKAWAADQSSLAPLLDFEERYQRIFLRRGLVIYCVMLLREIENGESDQ